MTNIVRLGAGASVLALAMVQAAPAFADGTTAGATITNNVTLNYQVGGVAQTAVTASNSSTVDRKVNLTVSEVGTSTTSVSPGQTSAVTSFSVTNASNAILDFALSAANIANGTAAHGGTDNVNVTNIKMYVDTDGNGAYTPVTDKEVTYLDQVAADASVKVFVVADVPAGGSTGDVAGVRLTATAAESTAANSLGAVVTQTTGANTSGVDTVFADSNLNGNVARDGIHFAEDDYTVLAASITATKTSKVISDPFNGTTDPKMIPGAVVEYCIIAANAAGSATATNVAISDTLPTETTYDAAFGIKVNGTVTNSACNSDGASGGSYASGIASGTIASLAAGESRTVVFRVSVK